jgi:hypothetical protein
LHPPRSPGRAPGDESTMKVAVTDYTFDDLDVERAILEPMGCQVVGPYGA